MAVVWFVWRVNDRFAMVRALFGIGIAATPGPLMRVVG
jgi:hypothetical protein